MALSVFPDTVLSGFSCRRPRYSMPTAEHQALIDRCRLLLSQWEALQRETLPRIEHDRAEGFVESAVKQDICLMVLNSCISELKGALGDMGERRGDRGSRRYDDRLSEGQQGGEADR